MRIQSFFQHIPVDEIYELLEKVPKGTKGADLPMEIRKGGILQAHGTALNSWVSTVKRHTAALRVRRI